MEALAEAGANVVGIDASEGYLEGARRNRSHTNIPYEHGDIRHMSSTAVLSTRPFQRWPWTFLPEFEQVVAEIKRVTLQTVWSHPVFTSFWRHSRIRPRQSHRGRS